MRVVQVTFRAIMLCMGVYVAMGVMGSLEFGERTPGNLLLAYHEDMMRGSSPHPPTPSRLPGPPAPSRPMPTNRAKWQTRHGCMVQHGGPPVVPHQRADGAGRLLGC
jgi:hypothetical protein